MEEEVLYCYCKSDERDQYMILCQQCKLRYHLGCLKTGRPSELIGDTYYKFVCQNCSSTGEELIERMKLQWTQVIILALYNLQIESGGKCGYFRWREHVCSFVDKHWAVFFGNKKKTNTWRGTVAGTLSAGCPNYFKSGLSDLGEPGWWALALSAVPEAYNRDGSCKRRGQKRKVLVEKEDILCQGLRQRPSKNAIQAAIELKEKRSYIMEAKEIRRALAEAQVTVETTSVVNPTPSFQNLTMSEKFRLTLEEDRFITNIKSEPPDTIFSDCSSPSVDSSEIDVKPILSDASTEASEQNVIVGNNWDIGNEEVFEQPVSPEQIDIMCDSVPDIGFLLQPVSGKELKKEVIDEEPTSSTVIKHANQSNPLTGNLSQKNETDLTIVKQEFRLKNEYEELQLFNQLNKLVNVLDENKNAKRLHRKLIVRQRQRELNKPVFDLEQQYKMLVGDEIPENNTQNSSKTYAKQNDSFSASVLDRFQIICPSAQGRSHKTFVTRLLGFEEDQLESIISPYTMRTLKPFIYRDYETTPTRLKLLQEIQEYPYKKEKLLCPTLHKHPIDYCYVKPHHIPVVNSLCREFFWPGIDLSECLQYPDFSVIAMYRKVVIGFAFMVPDVKYNEAYISFIFTHPEWRKAGIAKFMLYHLIQTCMGKDVTLHVSITNPACFLYHKFGFKVEETCLNFYDKYLPVRSNECRHALFMRLGR